MDKNLICNLFLKLPIFVCFFLDKLTTFTSLQNFHSQLRFPAWLVGRRTTHTQASSDKAWQATFKVFAGVITTMTGKEMKDKFYLL